MKSRLDVVKSDVGARAGKRQAVSPRLLAAAPKPLPGEAADLTRGARQARTKNRRSSGSCLTYFRRSGPGCLFVTRRRAGGRICRAAVRGAFAWWFTGVRLRAGARAGR